MASKLTRLTHERAIQMHLVAKSCTICSSRSRRQVRKCLDTPLYEDKFMQERMRRSSSRMQTSGKRRLYGGRGFGIEGSLVKYV